LIFGAFTLVLKSIDELLDQ